MARTEAQRRNARRYYLRNREKVIESRKEWARTHPEENKAQARRWKDNNPDKRKSDALKRKYGITLGDYNAVHDKQGGVCAVCKNPETVMARGKVLPLSVDHNHDTGKIRELLCAGCNKALAYARENPDTLRLLAAYVEKHNV